jgi:hypothetical protein
MAALQSHCRTVGGVTLVELCVTVTRSRRVHVENQLDGAVWPPRSDGVPEPGWDDQGFEGRAEPDETLVLGYASPADPADPPARIVEEDGPGDGEPTPQAVVKALGRREPPREAMPGRNTDSGGGGQEPADPRHTTVADPTSVSQPGTEAGDGSVGPSDAPFDAWLGAVERRLGTAEDLAEATSVREAEAAVEQAGGIAAVRRLHEQLQADRTALDRLAPRCSRVRERAGAVDVPVEALARLA